MEHQSIHCGCGALYECAVLVYVCFIELCIPFSALCASASKAAESLRLIYKLEQRRCTAAKRAIILTTPRELFNN